MVSYGLVYHISLGLHRPASLRFLCNFWKSSLVSYEKGDGKFPLFLCPFLCRLLHALYNGFVCRHRNHLQIFIHASGRCFCLLHEPPQSCTCFFCPQTNDSRMPCHHHSAVRDTGNLPKGFLYLQRSFLGALGHCRKACSCLLSGAAAKKETERKNNIFFQISTPISLLTYPRKLLSLHGKSSCFFRKKTVYHRTFVLQ